MKNKGQILLSIVVTITSGIIGLFIGAAMNMEGYSGVICSIASASAFIRDAINKK